jgi:hypothetical protein
LLAAAVGGAFGDADQFRGLSRQKRQCDRADALDLQAGRENLAGAEGAEIAGTLDLVQQPGKVGGDR